MCLCLCARVGARLGTCALVCVCVCPGRQLTIFNSQTTVQVGGGERGVGMFQGQLSGLYYNGLRILNMAAEGHPHIRVDGSARLVGDMPSSSITPQSSAAAGNRSDSAPSISDITTTTATNRKQGTTLQVRGGGEGGQDGAKRLITSSMTSLASGSLGGGKLMIYAGRETAVFNSLV